MWFFFFQAVLKDRAQKDNAFTRVYYTVLLTVWTSCDLAVKRAPLLTAEMSLDLDAGSMLSGLGGEERVEAGVIIIVCPGPSERHDHRPGSSSDSTEKPLIEDALEESEPERERQTEREKVEYGRREWNKQSNCQVSRKIAPTLPKDTAHPFLTALFLFHPSLSGFLLSLQSLFVF